MQNAELEKLGKFVDSSVDTDSLLLFGADIGMKIDVLQRALELLRHKHRHLENGLPFEDFLRGDLHVDRGVRFSLGNATKGLDEWKRPIWYQPRLLVSLLLHHGEQRVVFDIIEAFIGRIWDELTTLDFKRTRTGVVRCFTNARFPKRT